VYCHFFRYAQWVVYGQILLQQKLTDDWKSAQKRNIHGMRFVVVSGTGESNTSRSMFVNEVSKSTGKPALYNCTAKRQVQAACSGHGLARR